MEKIFYIFSRTPAEQTTLCCWHGKDHVDLYHIQPSSEGRESDQQIGKDMKPKKKGICNYDTERVQRETIKRVQQMNRLKLYI